MNGDIPVRRTTKRPQLNRGPGVVVGQIVTNFTILGVLVHIDRIAVKWPHAFRAVNLITLNAEISAIAHPERRRTAERSARIIPAVAAVVAEKIAFDDNTRRTAYTKRLRLACKMWVAIDVAELVGTDANIQELVNRATLKDIIANNIASKLIDTVELTTLNRHPITPSHFATAFTTDPESSACVFEQTIFNENGFESMPRLACECYSKPGALIYRYKIGSRIVVTESPDEV